MIDIKNKKSKDNKLNFYVIIKNKSKSIIIINNISIGKKIKIQIKFKNIKFYKFKNNYNLKIIQNILLKEFKFLWNN